MPVYPACGGLLPLPVHGSAQVGTSELGLSSEVPTCHEQLGGSNLSRARPKAMSLDECERIEFNSYSCFEYMRVGLEKNYDCYFASPLSFYIVLVVAVEPFKLRCCKYSQGMISMQHTH